jgi:hypothetical protein
VNAVSPKPAASKTDASRAPVPPVARLTLTRQGVWFILLLAVALTALWGSLSLELVGLLAERQGNAENGAARAALPPNPPAVPSAPGLPPAAGREASGPWGTIEYSTFSLQPPGEFLRVPEEPPAPPVWRFEQFTPADLVRFLGRQELTPAQQAWLLDTNRWSLSGPAIAIPVNPEIVWTLSISARQAIYTELANSPLNPAQQQPFTRLRHNVDSWFQNSGLQPETVDFVRRLAYPVGDSICLADAEWILARLRDRDEGHRLLKTLWQQESLLMRLRVQPNADLAPLLAYWAQGPNAKNIRPLLEALAGSPQGGSVDIAQLLPPLPRQLLNTFPLPIAPGAGLERNCSWTALNFFATKPDDRCADLAHARARLEEDYFPIVDDPQFGDVILVVQASGRPIHVASYIADDVVFTKNGTEFRRPWVLMKMDEMLAIYPSNLPLKLHAYRRKET